MVKHEGCTRAHRSPPQNYIIDALDGFHVAADCLQVVALIAPERDIVAFTPAAAGEINQANIVPALE